MGDNTFTKGYSDGPPLTEAELDTAYKSVKLDISNTALMTTGSSSGQFLKSNGDGLAASFAAVPDVVGPSSLRNYGFVASAATGALTFRLKTKAGATPSSSDPVKLTFSVPTTTSATYREVDVTGALSIAINSSATLGFTATSASRVYLYALDNTGAALLGVSATGTLDIGKTITTVAVGVTADTATTLYATAVLSVVPRLLGWTEAALNSSKQWQTPTTTVLDNNAPSDTAIYANAVARLRTRSTGTSTIGVGGIAISTSCGTFNGTNGGAGYDSVTNLSVTITTDGRPVRLVLQSSGTSGNGQVTKSNSTTSLFKWTRDGSTLAIFGASPSSSGVSASVFSYLDTTATAGTHTYAFLCSPNGSG